jgi:hypothetical protein
MIRCVLVAVTALRTVNGLHDLESWQETCFYIRLFGRILVEA